MMPPEIRSALLDLDEAEERLRSAHATLESAPVAVREDRLKALRLELAGVAGIASGLRMDQGQK